MTTYQTRLKADYTGKVGTETRTLKAGETYALSWQDHRFLCGQLQIAKPAEDKTLDAEDLAKKKREVDKTLEKKRSAASKAADRAADQGAAVRDLESKSKALGGDIRRAVEGEADVASQGSSIEPSRKMVLQRLQVTCIRGSIC